MIMLISFNGRYWNEDTYVNTLIGFNHVTQLSRVFYAKILIDTFPLYFMQFFLVDTCS